MGRTHRGGDDRGFALGLALLALVLVSGVVAWAVLLGLFSLRGGLNTVRLAQAFSAAEEGARLHVARADWRALAELPFGGSAPFKGSARAGTGWYRGDVTRLGSTVFLIQAEGFDAGSKSRQRVGILVRLQPLERRVEAALDASGAVQISDESRVLGRDDSPTGWDCPPLEPGVAALRVPAEDIAGVSTTGCSDGQCLQGDPDLALRTDPDGPAPGPGVNDLARFATKKLMGGTVRIGPASMGGECQIDALANWGDPTRPESTCGRHFPVVFSSGDLTITGGQGQALLIVDGDLLLAGDSNILGLVLVFGRLTILDGARVRGAVVVENTTAEATRVADRGTIAYSSCAVNRALAAASVPTSLRERSWIQLN